MSASSAEPLKVIVVEDDAADAELLLRSLADGWPGNLETVLFTRIGDLELNISGIDPDIVFCDLSLEDASGIEVVERAVAAAGVAPVVVLTSNADSRIPILSLTVGAQDYLTKGSLDGESLGRALRYSIARSAAERENKRIERDLSQIHRELDRYAHIMAHDLRAPVRTARLFADRLVAMSADGRDPTEIAAALDSSLERLELMIGRLQRMATLRDTELTLVEGSLATIVAEAASDLSGELLANCASLSCLRDAMVFADPVLIRDLVRELVQNAIDYRSSARDLAITVSAEQVGTTTVITVADNGIGIPGHHRDRVFRLFERLSTAEASSLGFGLAFCQQVVELHGGSISAVEPGGPTGAAIQVELPGPA